MELISLLKPNTIIITPNQVKLKFLKLMSENKLLVNVKFYTIEEIIKKVFFDYDLNTISYLTNSYHIKIENALMYLSNLYYIDETTSYNNEKLDYLVNIKKDLDKNKLLKYHHHFLSSLNNKQVIVVSYDYLDSLATKAIKKIQAIANVDIISKTYEVKANYKVIVYDFLEDEVEGVAKKIAALIVSGVNINDIKLANVDLSYHYTIKKIFNLYNIKVNLDKEASLYEIKMVNDFLKAYLESKDYNLAINQIEASYNLDDKINLDIFNKIIKVINSLINIKFINNDNLYEYLVYYFKKETLNNTKYDPAIEVIDLYNNEIDQDTYVFFLGFNQLTCPKTQKDEDYISDNIASLVNYTPSYIRNKINKETLINILNKVNKLFISFKHASNFDKYEPSLLIDELKMQVVKDELILNEITHSPSYDKIKLAKEIDNFIAYKTQSEKLGLLYHNYHSQVAYATYDNRFKGIDHDLFTTSFNKGIKLSYTSLNNYFKCNFRYYLNSVININEFEPSFYKFIGDLFHYILSKVNQSDFELETLVAEFIKTNDYEIDVKEKFLLIKLLDEFSFTLSFLQEHLSNSKFNVSETEKKFVIEYQDNVTITAIVDKIMTYKDENDKYIVLVDYKSGMFEFGFDYLDYGINLQLPLYYYFINKSSLYDDYKLAGFYNQKLINNEINVDKKKNHESLKKDKLKLQGYTINRKDIIEAFDNSYVSSKYIKSMALKSDGDFSSRAKLISLEESEEIKTKVEEVLNKAISNIKQGNFAINPIKINHKLLGCEFCDFKDICYKTYFDELDITKETTINSKEGDFDE